MEVLWNKINLQRPPFRPWNVSRKEFDARKFLETIQNILSDFQIFEALHTEAALLSRLIYRMKSKFRSDNGLKHMEKVNRALLNYLNMSIQREYELLKEYTEISNGIASLPSKQTLQYVLIRSQGFAKLMCRIELTANKAGTILKLRMHTGQSWSVAMIAYAIISRIWILSRSIIRKICKWYNSLYHYTNIFKIVGLPWMPDMYVLPSNLSEWLDIPWYHEDIERLTLNPDWDKSIFSLIKADKSVEDDSVINDSIIEPSQEVIVKPLTENNECIIKNDDLGKLVSREDFLKETKIYNIKENKKIVKIEGKKKDKNQKISKKSKLYNNKSEKDLVYLLKAETLPGFNKLQTSKLQKRLKKVLVKLTKNNTCSITDKNIKKVNTCIKKWISDS